MRFKIVRGWKDDVTTDRTPFGRRWAPRLIGLAACAAVAAVGVSGQWPPLVGTAPAQPDDAWCAEQPDACLLFADAVDTAGLIPDDRERSIVLSSVVYEQAQGGWLAGALGTTDQIPSDDIRSRSLVTLARAQVRAGQPEDARQTLADALAAVVPMAQGVVRSVLLQQIAVAQAEAGLVAVALETADIIADPADRAWTLRDVANIRVDRGPAQEAQGLLRDALALTDAIAGDIRRVLVMMDLASALADAGAVEAAEETFADAIAVARTIPGDADRLSALGSIAAAQAGAGLYADAHATAATIADSVYHAGALQSIARHQIDAGRLGDAADTADGITDPAARWYTLWRVAGAQAGAGRFAEARRIADRITDVDSRSATLFDVAVAQAEAGLFAEARATAEAIARDEREVSWILARIAHAQAAAGLLDDARAAFAEAIDGAEAQSYGDPSFDLASIARLQAEAGLLADARATADAIPRDTNRADALRDIAVRQLRSGMPEEAERTFADAVAVAGDVADDYARSWVLHRIAGSQTTSEALTEARATALAVADPELRAEALRDLAYHLAVAGATAEARCTFAEARDVAAAMTGDAVRSRTLNGVARAQAMAATGRLDQD